MHRLAGKIAIVTGSGGIGEACARRLAADGAMVIIGDIARDHADAVAGDIVAGGGKAEARHVDISDEQSVAAFIAGVKQAHGRLDVLHNNAADTCKEQMARDMAIAEMPIEIWDQAFHINTRGTMLMTKHAIPLMLENGAGSIINTSSGAALRGDLFGPAYAASKAAINCLTLYTATQYGKRGIRCNVVSPGLVVTPNVHLSNSRNQLDRIEQHKLTPFLGEPDDIAKAVSFLASDESRFMTAQIMVIDGGILDHMPYFSETIQGFEASSGHRNV